MVKCVDCNDASDLWSVSVAMIRVDDVGCRCQWCRRLVKYSVDIDACVCGGVHQG